MSIKISKIYRISDEYKTYSSNFQVGDSLIEAQLIEKVPISKYSSHKGLRRLPKATQNAIVSAISCIGDSLNSEEKEKLGVFVGTSLSYVEHGLQFMSEAYRTSPRLVSPLMFPNTVLNSISGWISIVLGSNSINTTINTGQNSGIDTIKVASEFLNFGIIDKALVVITEELSEAIIESDLCSSESYGEETIALLLTLNSEDESEYEITEIYSRYLTEDSYRTKLEELNADSKKTDFLFINDIDLESKKEKSLRNLLSCTAINYMYEAIKNKKTSQLLISERSGSGVLSYLKLGRITDEYF